LAIHAFGGQRTARPTSFSSLVCQRHNSKKIPGGYPVFRRDETGSNLLRETHRPDFYPKGQFRDNARNNNQSGQNYIPVNHTFNGVKQKGTKGHPLRDFPLCACKNNGAELSPPVFGWQILF
jgi:hypothetical protein